MKAPPEHWLRAGVEPRLEDLINDPIVRLVMRRDKVAPPDLLQVVAGARARLRKPRAGARGSRASTATWGCGQRADA